MFLNLTLNSGFSWKNHSHVTKFYVDIIVECFSSRLFCLLFFFITSSSGLWYTLIVCQFCYVKDVRFFSFQFGCFFVFVFFVFASSLAPLPSLIRCLHFCILGEAKIVFQLHKRTSMLQEIMWKTVGGRPHSLIALKNFFSLSLLLTLPVLLHLTFFVSRHSSFASGPRASIVSILFDALKTSMK